MKILIIMDPGIIIPVKGYGGHERLVEMFAKEYCRLGHKVHLLITKGSTVDGCTVHDFGKEGFPPAKSDALKAVPFAWKFLWKHRNDFDLIHNFGRLAYLLPVLRWPVKKIMTYGREIDSKNIRIINTLKAKNLLFTGCSENLLSRVKAKGNWEVVSNAIDFSAYRLQPAINEEAPLIFLGRIEKVKGCHTAIKIAKATGNQLIIAGNISPLAEEKIYFEKEIFPHIDGKQVHFVGPVNDAQKNILLGKAKALLFPIEWNEPFGIVMIEAMACGTPVIAFNRGAVEEVIDEGITGFKVNTAEQMITALDKLKSLPRAQCRQQAMQRFDVRIIAQRYLHLVSGERKRIIIISTHEPAANPRAMKEFETLKQLGYSIKFFYVYNAGWSYRINEDKFDRGILSRHDFIRVGGNPYDHPFSYFISRGIRRVCRTFAGAHRFLTKMSMARAAFELWITVKKYPADLYIAHYLGALPAAIKAAGKFKAKVIFDAEDFHRGEQTYYPAEIKNIISVENMLLPHVNAITTASPLITKAYKEYYPHQNIETINNVFSKKFLQAAKPSYERKLKFFWFSQNIGRYRGLEIFIKALNLLPDADISVTIMGNNRSKLYLQELVKLSRHPEKIIFRSSVHPEEIFSIAANYDVGLAGEEHNCLNKEICLSNKIFTYLLAGNAILASDMQGQKEFMQQYPGIGFTYRHNDAKDLADKIEILYNDRQLLEQCKQNARIIAENELNWEAEKEKWLLIVNNLLNNKIVTSIDCEPFKENEYYYN